MIGFERYSWEEEALGEGEQFLARAIETNTDGVIIVAPNGRITFLNPAAERLLGVSHDEMIGRPYTDLNFVAPDGEPVPIEDRPTTQVLRTGGAVYGVEMLLERPDGARSVLSANASPLTDLDGEMTGVVISLRDVTERKNAEDALRQHAAALRAQAELLDLAHDAIFVRDLWSGAVVYWNRGAEELYGFRREEAIGRISHELLRTQFPRPLREIEEIMVRTGRWDGELVHCTRAGREVVVESRWALQRDEHGEPLAFLEINHDVTARKQAEAELARRVDELAVANREALSLNRELLAVNAAIAAISGSLDLQSVLQRIVDAARELIQSRYAALGVADGRGRIVHFITSGITAEQRAAIGPLPEGHGLLGILIREGTPLRIPNIAADPGAHGFPPNHPPMTSLLGVPVLFQGRAVGDLYLTDKIGASEFSEDDERLLTLLANHAAIAIENARLYEEVRAGRDQLRTWNRELEARVAERTREIERTSKEITTRVLKAQEEERKRIARELHDDTAQSLTTLLINLDVLNPHIPDTNPALVTGMARLEQLLKRTLDEVRALSHDLRPTILDDVGLVPALEVLAEDHTRTFGVPVTVSADPIPGERLAPEMEIALYRIVQEALMNAGKYARATSVQVRLACLDDTVQLVVEDDGAGFDVEHLTGPSRDGGMGLYGMRERAGLLQGVLSVDTSPGHGTRITVRAPMMSDVPTRPDGDDERAC